MEISLGQQARLRFFAFLLGFFLGFVYDLVRILRIAVGIGYDAAACRAPFQRELPLIHRRVIQKRKRIGRIFEWSFVFCGDLFFMIFAGISFSLLLYAVNDGQFRFFALIALLPSFFIYYFTVGRLILFFAGYIVLGLRAVALYIGFFLFCPLRVVFRGILFVLGKLRLLLRRFYDMIRLRLYSAYAYRYVLKEAERSEDAL